jgi:hypothetical protein
LCKINGLFDLNSLNSNKIGDTGNQLLVNNLDLASRANALIGMDIKQNLLASK